MDKTHGFECFRLHFDADGKLEDTAEREAWLAHAKKATDAILIAHGFRNSEAEAAKLYANFLKSFRQQVDGAFADGLGGRAWSVATVFWPSKKFDEGNVFGEGGGMSVDKAPSAEKRAVKKQLEAMKAELKTAAAKKQITRALVLLDEVEGSGAKQDEFVKCLLSTIDSSRLDKDKNEGWSKIRGTQGSVLLSSIEQPLDLKARRRRAAADEGGISGPDAGSGARGGGSTMSIVSAAGSLFGGIGMLLNCTTWYTMKDRAGVVGEKGVAPVVKKLAAGTKAPRVHLVGHSLGGRLMAGCAKGLAGDQRVDTLLLLEAAFSHYGFSPGSGKIGRGYFRDVVQKKVVKGPIVATFSEQDTVVGKIYAIASRLSGDTTRAIGDANDPFGGIGRNGAQATAESKEQRLRADRSARYDFSKSPITCLDGSGGGIQDHGDVTSPAIAFAFACALNGAGG